MDAPHLAAERARTPARFRARVIAQFRDPRNLAYLRAAAAARLPPSGAGRAALLADADAMALTFSEGAGEIYDLLDSDALAGRGRAVGFWAEVRRVNAAFLARLAASARAPGGPGGRPPNPGEGQADDDEPYHVQAFVADSLRPPGLEHLNTPGPLYALREDAGAERPYLGTHDQEGPGGGYALGGGRGAPRPRDAGHPEAFTGRPAPTEDDEPLGGDDGDEAWAPGDANRTPEQALAEYWGEGWSATRLLGAATAPAGDGVAWGRAAGRDGALAAPCRGGRAPGARFMRYEAIPFWQKGGREGYDADIEETLGQATREMGAHVRRFDMERYRAPRGDAYLRPGPRSGDIV